MPGGKLMQAVNYLELVLIELEYAAADCDHRKKSTSSASDRAELEALLSKIKGIKLIIQYALDNMQTKSDIDLPMAV
jgi:hypothetical protein